MVAVTLGPDGVVGASGVAGATTGLAPEVQVVDTVGAGDSFTGALLAGLSRRDLLGASRRADLLAVDAATLQEVADEAVLAAAITCTRHGADPPTSADLRTALA